jgi:hypothetical protein
LAKEQREQAMAKFTKMSGIVSRSKRFTCDAHTRHAIG